MSVLNFLASMAGRWTRGIVGAVLIVLGLTLGGAGFVLAALGVVFVLVGIFDVCLLAPLFGWPPKGVEARKLAAR